MEGTVNRVFQVVIPITVQGSAGERRTINAVLDTGFNRFLTLPSSLISELDLRLLGKVNVTLANGSRIPLEVYRVTLFWDGSPRRILAYAAESTPLIGMRLLHGHSLHVDVLEGGRVAIEALS